ncbi:sigma-54 interaction domain-containing protein [Brevibacillus fluminis]|uniref:sigma-54 interaction domain-containing protein n=1 Tax=Brevibacillus fluminis TaxID=511487 RepID=UPI003F8C0CC4
MRIRKGSWVHRLLRRAVNNEAKVTKEMHIVKTAMDQAYEGVIIVDAQGYITSANQSYATFIGTTLDQMIGRHVTEVVENTRMHIVAKTEKAEIAQLQKINGHQMIASRIPIFSDGELVAVVGKIMFQDVSKLFELNAKYEKLKKELELYKQELNKRLGAKYSFDSIIGTSKVIEDVKALAKKVAKSDSTILLNGESGTGKELFAHSIHLESHRKNGPLIRVNCSAIPESLFESELFGYKEGSFTGAKKSGQKGKFSLANNGTIFLDEISELPMSMQVKLLRVLQEKEIEPVGAEMPEPIDVRIVAASNKSLEELVEQGTFRKDLFYRLNVVALHIPALRERKEDIPVLAEHLIQQLEIETGIPVGGIEPAALEMLLAYEWPGNVRELRNVLERAMYVKSGDMITEQELRAYVTRNPGASPAAFHQKTLQHILHEAEEEAIRKALKEEKGNKLAAAQRLGISKSSLYAKLEKYYIGKD